MNIDVILGADREVVGVHVDGRGATFVLEERYEHSMPIDSGWTARRYVFDDSQVLEEEARHLRAIAGQLGHPWKGTMERAWAYEAAATFLREEGGHS